MRTRLLAWLLITPFVLNACKCTFIMDKFKSAKLNDLATYNDNDFSQKATQFGPLGPVYAKVTTSQNPGDAKIEFRFVIKDAGTVHNVTVTEYTRRVDLEGNSFATYWVSPSVPLAPGNYLIEADLVSNGKVIDKKSTDFKIVSDAMAPMPPLNPGQDASDFME